MTILAREIRQLETGFESLARQHDELVQTVLDGVVIVRDMEIKDAVLDLLLSEARNGFNQAARKMVGGDLDLYTEAGLAEARRTYNEVVRYREMISWIMASIEKAFMAAQDIPAAENMMREHDE